jgi:hypothetical protein
MEIEERRQHLLRRRGEWRFRPVISRGHAYSLQPLPAPT